MPKRRSDVHHTYRIELQQSEREIVEMVGASMAAKNIGAAVGSFVTPFTTATIPGVVLWGSVLAAIMIELESRSPGAMFPNTVGQLGANEEVTPFYPPREGESAKSYRERTTFASRLKYGLWTQPKQTLKEDWGNLMDSIS